MTMTKMKEKLRWQQNFKAMGAWPSKFLRTLRTQEADRQSAETTRAKH